MKQQWHLNMSYRRVYVKRLQNVINRLEVELFFFLGFLEKTLPIVPPGNRTHTVHDYVKNDRM